MALGHYVKQELNMSTFETEKAFLAAYDIHQFDVPLSTVDLCIFTLRENALQVLAVRRADYPCKDRWALPGGFIDIQQDVDLEATARRILTAKTGVASPYLEQMETVGNAHRDPRGWSLTVVYFALVPVSQVNVQTRRVTEAKWAPVEEVMKWDLAFDHAELLMKGLARLRSKVGYSTLPVHIMPETFTLGELQQAYEIIMDRKVDKKAFRRRIEAAGLLEETGEQRQDKGRPAKVYRVKEGMQTFFYSRTI